MLGRDVVYVKLEELLEKNLAVWVASDLDFFSKFVANIVRKPCFLSWNQTFWPSESDHEKS